MVLSNVLFRCERVLGAELEPRGFTLEHEVDLTYALIMDLLRQALLAPDAVSYVNAG